MIIILSPQRRDDTIEIVRKGKVLTINGEKFDFSPMEEGATLPREAIDSPFFDGPVEMQNGELTLTLILPNPANYSQEQAFPEPLTNVPDGLVTLPQPLPIERMEVATTKADEVVE